MNVTMSMNNIISLHALLLLGGCIFLRRCVCLLLVGLSNCLSKTVITLKVTDRPTLLILEVIAIGLGTRNTC